MTQLLVFLLQSTALLSLGLLALHLTRRFGPAVQSLIGRASLVGVALLLLLAPLTGHVRPVVRVEMPQKVEPTPQQAATLPKREGEEVWAGGAASGNVPKTNAAFAEKISAAEAVRQAAVSGQKSMTGQEGAASSAPTMPAPATTAPRLPVAGGPLRGEERASKEVGSFSLAISLALLLWLAVCQFHLMRLRRTAQLVADGPAAALLAALTPSPPALLTHPSVHSPFLAGIRRPAIFLPSAFAADFTPDALRAVFLHELAHRERRDTSWTLAARLLTAILWFQPLLWLLARKLEQISEDACDTAVLAAHCPPRAYAACLLSLAERPPLARSQRTLTAGVAPFRSSVGRRIHHILTSQGVHPMPPLTLRLRLTAAALTIAAALGGAFLISSAPAQTAAPAAPAPALVFTFQEQQYHAAQGQDLQNLKEIGLALTHYAEKHNERLPDAAHWIDQTAPYLPNASALYDPFQPGQKRYGYALNRNCSGKQLSAFAAPSETVALFDSTLGTRNASDTGQSLHFNPLALSRVNIIGSGYGFVDGHAKWINQEVRPSFALDGGTPAAAENRAALVQKLAEGQRKRTVADLTPVQGPGVVVTLTNSRKPFLAIASHSVPQPNLVHASDIREAIQELNAAGAKATAVNGQRIVAANTIQQARTTILFDKMVINNVNQILINHTPQNSPYMIKAIGSPKMLTAALNKPRSLAARIKAYDPSMFTVQPSVRLTLPAYPSSRPISSAKFISVGKAQVSDAFRLQQRSFVVNFQTPQSGAHTIQVFVQDAAGKRLVWSKVYRQRTQVNLPVTAAGRLVSFQIYDNGKLTKTQQMTSGPAPAASAAQNQATAGMHTVIGYGLVAWKSGKVFQCRALKDSQASHLGILLDRNYLVLAVNGQPVPQSTAQFAEIVRAAPPLRLLLEFPGRPTHTVTFHTKEAYTTSTDAANAEGRVKEVQSAQEEAAKSKAALAQTNRQLIDEIDAALPQAEAQTQAKALNLEKHIGGTEWRVKFSQGSIAWYKKKHNVKRANQEIAWVANIRSGLKVNLAEEAKLFPQAVETSQKLSHIHTLAEQAQELSLTATEKQIQSEVITSVMRQRSPDMSL